MIRRVHTSEAPTPRGHYSQALVSGGHVHVSAQLPLVPSADSATELSLLERPPAEQARQALANLLAIVREAGGSEETLVSLRFYVADVAAWPAADEACVELLGDHRPARAVVPTGGLHLGFAVAVEGIGRVSPD